MLGTVEQRIEEMLGIIWLRSRAKLLVLLKRKSECIWLCIWGDKVSKMYERKLSGNIYTSS